MQKSIVSAIAGLALLALGTGAHAQDMLTLKLATGEVDINPTSNSILKLAARLGFYEKHGVKVEIVELDGTPQSVAALTSGAVDLADVSIDAAIRLAVDNGLKLKGITAGGFGAAFMIASKTDITSIDGLVGRSFAVADNGSLDHNLTLGALRANDIPEDGPKFVAIGAPAARVQALAAGQVDATTVSYGTFMSIEGTPGIHALMSANEFAAYTPNISKFIAALDTTVAEKPEALKRFVAALIDISRIFDEHPEQWVDAVAAARDDLQKEDLARIARTIEGRWCVNGCFNDAELVRAIDYVYTDNPEFKDYARVSAADLTDGSFVQSALDAAGVIDDPSKLDKR